MNRNLGNILVTGGMGFMGSDFIRFLLGECNYPYLIVNYDAMTYAANSASLECIQDCPNYHFVEGNIVDAKLVHKTCKKFGIQTIVHFAAETHVDRSIDAPSAFIHTNVLGTATLLQTALDLGNIYVHAISTDEVYGQLGPTGVFSESSPYAPRSPYAASKASSDHITAAFGVTYDLPVTISHASNNFGPWQNFEKLIPKTIMAMLFGKAITVYGSGKNIREWLFVRDHSKAVWKILQQGRWNEVYNIGGGTAMENIEMISFLIDIGATVLEKNKEELENLICYIEDRKGHDFRYSLSNEKMKREFHWEPTVSFREGIQQTFAWYYEVFTKEKNCLRYSC